MKQTNKKTDSILLLPGAGGWEIWKGSSELSLVKASGEREALAVDGIPNGDLVMAFAIKDVSAAPFVAATGEAGMFEDLSSLHLERSGLKVDEEMGQLSDCFELNRSEEEAQLLPVVLTPPEEGGLPARSPKGFDVSARCLPLPADTLVLWREFGRWVFAVSNEAGKIIYFQALPGVSLNREITRELSFSVAQLTMQGLLDDGVKECIIWCGSEEIEPPEESRNLLAERLKKTVRVEAKPAPVLPAELSRLLPDDVRAERVAKRKKQQGLIAIAALIALYLGGIGFLAYQYFQEKEKLEIAQAKLANSSPEALAVRDFLAKWDELKPLVENEYWPVELFYNAYQQAPKQGLRVTRAEMRNELQALDGASQVLKRNIIIQGNTDEPEQALQLDENLKKSDYFTGFEWNNPNPAQARNERWSFIYTGEPVGG